MKELVLTRSQVEELKASCRTIEELIKQIEMNQQKDGNVICQFVINGIRLSDQDEVRMRCLNIRDLETVSLFLDKPENLLHEIIQNWRQEIPKIIAHADGLSSLIRERGVETQISSFIQLIESCQLLVQSLISISNVIDTQKIFETGQWYLSENLLAEAVGETLKIFDQKDSKTLADVIEYDLANALMNWLEIFDILVKHHEPKIIFP